MCGIYAYKGPTFQWSELKDESDKIKYRGPDNSTVIKVDDEIVFAFHRLAIMGTTSLGDQPLVHPGDKDLTLICNGEIYNYKDLAWYHGFDLKTGSDCEIILHMYKLSLIHI